MLTVREREAVAQAALRWPKRKGHLFMRTVTHRGAPIQNERDAILAIREKPTNTRYAAPEVLVAHLRQDLSPVGVARAFSDLMRLCRAANQNYLDLLDENPQALAQMMMEGTQQRELW